MQFKSMDESEEQDKEEREEQRKRTKARLPGEDIYGRPYMEHAQCDSCGNDLEGSGLTCELCGAVVCTGCACDDGKCPNCTTR